MGLMAKEQDYRTLVFPHGLISFPLLFLASVFSFNVFISPLCHDLNNRKED